MVEKNCEMKTKRIRKYITQSMDGFELYFKIKNRENMK